MTREKLIALLRQQGCEVSKSKGSGSTSHPFKVTHELRPGRVLSVGKSARFDGGSLYCLRRKFKLMFGWAPLF